MIRRALSILAFAAAACSDATGLTGLNGLVTFTFTGAGGGTFSVTAAAPTPGTAPGMSANMTAGVTDAAEGQTLIMAFRSISEAKGDLLVLGINRITVGSSPVAADCDPETDPCSGLVFGVNFDTEGDTYDYFCALLLGTITITEVTTTRIVGTFSGSGECSDAASAGSPFAVTNGSFNVALIAAGSL